MLSQEEKIIFDAVEEQVQEHIKCLQELKKKISEAPTEEVKRDILRYFFEHDIGLKASKLAEYEQTKFIMLQKLYSIKEELKRMEKLKMEKANNE